MIYHESFGSVLRLGNFLFKFAWSIAMKEKFKVDTMYPEYYLWQYLENKPIISFAVDYWEDQMLRPNKWEWSPEEELFVDNIVKSNPSLTVALNFFFQSEKWFRNYRDEVYKSLQFKQEEIDRVKERYSYLFNSC